MAAERRREREAQRRLRELDRQAQLQARRSAVEQSRMQVEAYEERVELLRSVHKEQGEVWDWPAVAASLPPHLPLKNSFHEQKANQRFAVLQPDKKEAAQFMLEKARLQDEQDFQAAMQSYSKEIAEWAKLKNMARRILDGEHKAYTEALLEFNPFADISDLGSSINFTVHDAKLVECALKVNGRQIIPAEVKTLTASEKVSTKPMPKGLFHEIYLEYLCGCVLRVAREVFALLPVERLLITAAADSLDTRTGQTVEQPVLSVAIQRSGIAGLDFERLNPADSIQNFTHRDEFKASRKSDSFHPIAPLSPEDIAQATGEETTLESRIRNVHKMREELKTTIADLKLPSAQPTPLTKPTL
jgi:hypothetical protein